MSQHKRVKRGLGGRHKKGKTFGGRFTPLENPAKYIKTISRPIKVNFDTPNEVFKHYRD